MNTFKLLKEATTKKHYTFPTISDLHIGLRCEIRKGEENWKQTKLTPEIFIIILEEYIKYGVPHTYGIRIKALTEFDFIALGFRRVNDKLFIHKLTPRLKIELYDRYKIKITKKNKLIFFGTIKTRYELQTILNN